VGEGRGGEGFSRREEGKGERGGRGEGKRRRIIASQLFELSPIDPLTIARFRTLSREVIAVSDEARGKKRKEEKRSTSSLSSSYSQAVRKTRMGRKGVNR